MKPVRPFPGTGAEIVSRPAIGPSGQECLLQPLVICPQHQDSIFRTPAIPFTDQGQAAQEPGQTSRPGLWQPAVDEERPGIPLLRGIADTDGDQPHATQLKAELPGQALLWGSVQNQQLGMVFTAVPCRPHWPPGLGLPVIQAT